MVASITAQNSLGVDRVVPVAAEVLDAQLAALAADLRPSVIKTGLIGSAEGVAVLMRWLARFDAEGGPRVRLVVDPVLGASAGGAAFCDDALLAAYRERLLPRADLITPNRREAARLLGVADAATPAEVPARPRRCVRSGPARWRSPAATARTAPPTAPMRSTGSTRRWHAAGSALPRLDARHTHGTGCTFATSAAAAMARGFVTADALVLAAKMATTAAIAAGHAAGQAPGRSASMRALRAMRAGCRAWAATRRRRSRGQRAARAVAGRLYAISDSFAQAAPLLAAAAEWACARCRLRIKRAAHRGTDDAAFAEALQVQIGQAQAAITVRRCRAAGAGDQRPPRAGARRHRGRPAGRGVDRVAPGPGGHAGAGRGRAARLAMAQARGLRLGLSSHSL